MAEHPLQRMKLKPLEWKVFKTLQSLSVQQTRCLVALSSGLDSVVLLRIMERLAERLQLKLSVGHVHHGLSSIASLDEYRLRAQAFASELAQAGGWPFFSNSADPKPTPQSEESLREARYEKLEEWRLKAKAEWIVLAHTADDQLETRLLHLMRGTRTQGLFAMQHQSPPLLRPLLRYRRAEMEEYARAESLCWVEDPSNQDPAYLRNWLRHHWLRELETRSPGSVARLGASLQALAESTRQSLSTLVLEDYLLDAHTLDRSRLMTLPESEQGRVLALFLRALGLRGYSHGQISEILKRLKTPSNKLEFVVAGLLWTANAQQLSGRLIRRR